MKSQIIKFTLTMILSLMTSLAFASYEVHRSDERVINKKLEFKVHFIFYGTFATEEIARMVRRKIYRVWNNPRHKVMLNGERYRLKFDITFDIKTEDEVSVLAAQNTDPKINFVRIEEENGLGFSYFKDRDNSGFFRVADIYSNHKTIEHEFGHVLGLVHYPNQVQDFRGTGAPSINATPQAIVDQEYARYQNVIKLKTRRVTQMDIEDLHLDQLQFDSRNIAVFGGVSNDIYSQYLDHCNSSGQCG